MDHRELAHVAVTAADTAHTVERLVFSMAEALSRSEPTRRYTADLLRAQMQQLEHLVAALLAESAPT